VPMDDDDEDEEEEEEYLDDEASDDNWVDADGIAPFNWEGPTAGPGRWANLNPLQDPLDDLPSLPSMRVDFARLAGGRRLPGMRMGAAPAAAAGVWDDVADGLDGLPDPMMMTGEHLQASLFGELLRLCSHSSPTQHPCPWCAFVVLNQAAARLAGQRLFRCSWLVGVCW